MRTSGQRNNRQAGIGDLAFHDHGRQSRRPRAGHSRRPVGLAFHQPHEGKPGGLAPVLAQAGAYGLDDPRTAAGWRCEYRNASPRRAIMAQADVYCVARKGKATK